MLKQPIKIIILTVVCFIVLITPVSADTPYYSYNSTEWSTSVAAPDSYSYSKVISGEENNGSIYLNPQGSATREQVATILMEFCKNVKK